MKSIRILALAAPLALVVACGGTGSSGATSGAALAAAAPSYATLAMDLTPADATGSTTQPPPVTPPVADPCNPHLFVRSHEVVERVNRHLYKFLVHVEHAIAGNPTLTTGSSAEWDKSRGGTDAKLTVTRTTDTLYDWTLLLKKTQDSTFVEVASGAIDKAGASAKHEGKGNIQLDLTKLATVSREEVAGTISASFETFADHRLLAVQATGVVWDTDARHAFRRAPRDASYVYYRAPGKGGSLKITEETPLACHASPAVTSATVNLVNRWYVTPAGAVNGRSDAQLTGDQLTALGIAKLEGLTCHAGATEKALPDERAWLLKAEDAAGATVWGFQSVVGLDACDPLLNPPDGAVPSLKDATTDFSFTGIDFADGKPYPFPGL
jgi:hypothetical protein